VLLPLPLWLLLGVALLLDGIDLALCLAAQALDPFACALGLRARGRGLGWRLPRHPALCLTSSSATSSMVDHSTDRGLGHALLGYHDLYVAAPAPMGDYSSPASPSAPASPQASPVSSPSSPLAASPPSSSPLPSQRRSTSAGGSVRRWPGSGGVALVGRAEAVARTKGWMAAKMRDSPGSFTTGYSFQG